MRINKRSGRLEEDGHGNDPESPEVGVDLTGQGNKVILSLRQMCINGFKSTLNFICSLSANIVPKKLTLWIFVRLS